MYATVHGSPGFARGCLRGAQRQQRHGVLPVLFDGRDLLVGAAVGQVFGGPERNWALAQLSALAGAAEMPPSQIATSVSRHAPDTGQLLIDPSRNCFPRIVPPLRP
jgi:hypothetical protein